MINVKPVQQTHSGKKKVKQDKQKSRASTNKAPIITKNINESNLPMKRQRFSEWVFKKGKLKKNPAML